MNIFLTGGHGFIGTNLVAFLKKYRPDIRIFAPQREALDLSSIRDVARFVQLHNIDSIVHLANTGGGRDTLGIKNTLEANLRMHQAIIAQAPRVDRILSFGSGAEYGKHQPIIAANETDALSSLPQDAYGLSKYIMASHAQVSTNVYHLRLFGVYGVHENYRYKFISNAIVKSLIHMPITIYQNTYFDYLYIDDLLRIVVWFLEHRPSERIFNVSRGKKIDLLTLAHYVVNVCGEKNDIRLLHSGLGNEYTSDNTRLMHAMGEFDFTDYVIAIRTMCAYYRTHINALDTETVRRDPYLGKIQNIWKGKT